MSGQQRQSHLFHRQRDTAHQRYAPPPGPPPANTHPARPRPPRAPPAAQAPPAWEPAPEHSHAFGLYNETSDADYAAALEFCARHPPDPPRLLSSAAVERIDAAGCRAWALEWPSSSRWSGTIQNCGEKGRAAFGAVQVATAPECREVCLMSDLPIIAGLYDVRGKEGVYYELKIKKMDGIIAIGTACKPHLDWRYPGWDRLSAGLHLDDFRKFFEDTDGGRDYTPLLDHIAPGDTIGCGYRFATGSVFFTYNGSRLPDAFTGVYVPRTAQDVYAAIGVEGANEFEVNFGGDVFQWLEGNEWQWRIEGHVGRLSGGPAGPDDELPSYSQVAGPARRRR